MARNLVMTDPPRSAPPQSRDQGPRSLPQAEEGKTLLDRRAVLAICGLQVSRIAWLFVRPLVRPRCKLATPSDLLQ